MEMSFMLAGEAFNERLMKKMLIHWILILSTLILLNIVTNSKHPTLSPLYHSSYTTAWSVFTAFSVQTVDTSFGRINWLCTVHGLGLNWNQGLCFLLDNCSDESEKGVVETIP